MQFWGEDAVFETPCPKCSAVVEFFKDESSARCTGCGHRFPNPKLDQGCAQWCPYAAECLGFEPDRSAPEPVAETSGPLASRLIQAMKDEFGADQQRIGHALVVFQHAKQFVQKEGGDPRVVFAAAILHDIGIQEAERKHGSGAPPYQEAEGPPIARRIMRHIGLDEEAIEHVCRIVGSHHSGGDVDTVEFRVIWDADRIVNLSGELGDASPEEVEAIIERDFKTETGKRKARKLFLSG